MIKLLQIIQPDSDLLLLEIQESSHMANLLGRIVNFVLSCRQIVHLFCYFDDRFPRFLQN